MNARGTNHEVRLLVMAMMAVCSSVSLAMPTQQELKKAQPLVAELMAPIMDDFKAKKKTAAEVADMAVKYAGEAETEAAKFMLYRSSIPYYVRGEAYDKAADAVEQMKANVKDVPASVIEEIISKATVRATAKKAPRLFELYRLAKTQSVAEKDIAAFRAKLKKNPGSLPTTRNLAEALATSGDWDAALKEFAKLKDGAAQIAKKELDGGAKSAELGEFWWSYKPTYENADDTFEMRATIHYRKALDAGEITGLKKNIVEQRIAKYGTVAVVASGHGTGVSPRTPAATGLYCVIDLSGGPGAKKYSVSYLNDIPKGGWSDEYKTTKLVLRRIEPGAFMMGEKGKNRHVAIKEPYYMGVFEVTQKQWSLIIGDRPSFWKGPQWSLRPVEQVTYDRIRGENLGRKWPESDEVDEYSFMWLLRQKTGLRFDLPTEAQWEYACRAGTTTAFHNNCEMVNWVKDPSLDKIARYQGTGSWNDEKWGKFDWGKAWSVPDRDCGTNNGTAAVGSYQPNNWGLYDMLGNVAELCLDYENATNAEWRVVRGGYWAEHAYVSTAHWRGRSNGPGVWFGYGFRLCLPLAGGAVKSAPAATTPSAGPIGLKTGGNSPFTVNGNVATLKLANGEKIEFVQCPPGEFKMLKGYEKNASTVKVKISRPFWIARKRMTRGQRGAIAPNVPKLQPSAGNENVTFEGNVRNADEEMLLRRLTDDFGKSLPAGYVFRLPSIAEYEYAYHANTKDWNDPYIYDDFANVNKGTVEKMRAKDDDSLANAWGLLAMANLNALMDRFPIAFAGGQRRYDERMKGIELAEGTTDPFFWCEEDAYPMTACWGNFNMRCLHNGRAYRLVIGPDLVSEWKAKNAKK